MISSYLVEYPFEIGARRRIGLRCNCLKFNGYDRVSVTISEPTESAGAFHGALALLMIMVVSMPSFSEFVFTGAADAAACHSMRAFADQGESPARPLDEELARMEALGAVAGECGVVRRTVGVFPGT